MAATTGFHLLPGHHCQYPGKSYLYAVRALDAQGIPIVVRDGGSRRAPGRHPDRHSAAGHGSTAGAVSPTSGRPALRGRRGRADPH